ncbi:MAG: hypothetical protein DWQ19_11145 [Crenarchaeota archaeon]|nr:MAG: hypothetical protein DWQ19_11145 [Thermoproteota archaeon]
MSNYKNEYLDNFFELMRKEREYAAQWGDDFDAKNTPNDWVAYVTRYLGQTVTMPWDAKKFKEQMVKTATLCASAVEWCDRTNGDMAKRHYDKD